MAFSDINPVQHKQLFLDDDAIASMEGVKRTLHQPEKQGPVIKPDHSQEQVSLQSRSAPQWNPEKDFWEWWYWGNYTVPPHGPHHSTMMRVNLYATSTDGLHWERPSLHRYEWRGTTANNIAHDPNAETLYHIIRDASEQHPQRRYKALFGVGDRALGVSPDGFDWTMLNVPPIPSQDESHFIYDEFTAQYLAFVKHGTEWGRSVWLSTSTDFVHFTEPELIFHSDELDQEHRKRRIEKVVQSPAHLSPPLVDDTDHLAQVYQMAVMPYAENLYIGFPVLFNPAGAIPPPQRNFTGLNQVELTVSRDLQNWERVADRALFIEVDEWDGINYGTAQNLLCGRPIVHEDSEIRFYYNALRFRGHKELHPAEYAEFFNDVGALCLAKLRFDGFVSLDADTEGTVTTKPFTLTGEHLIVNADATHGELRAEILDAETLAPLPELSLQNCIPLHGDHLRGHIRWGTQPKSEKPVCIRFTLKQAKLYAFSLMADESQL